MEGGSVELGVGVDRGEGEEDDGGDSLVGLTFCDNVAAIEANSLACLFPEVTDCASVLLVAGGG